MPPLPGSVGGFRGWRSSPPESRGEAFDVPHRPDDERRTGTARRGCGNFRHGRPGGSLRRSRPAVRGDPPDRARDSSCNGPRTIPRHSRERRGFPMRWVSSDRPGGIGHRCFRKTRHSREDRKHGLSRNTRAPEIPHGRHIPIPPLSEGGFRPPPSGSSFRRSVWHRAS